MNNEEYTEQEAIEAVQDIAKQGLENGEVLNEIESDLTDINEHVANIDEYLVINNKEAEENKEDEQKAEEIIEEKNTKAGESENEEQGEEISIENVYTEIVQTNQHLENQTQLLTVGIFSQGIIIGVLLLTLLWNRFIK